MGRRQLEDNDIRKLQRGSSGSYYVTIPISLIRDKRWRDGQKLIVKETKRGIQITDWEE